MYFIFPLSANDKIVICKIPRVMTNFVIKELFNYIKLEKLSDKYMIY